jgi:WD40 repeat protein
VDGNRSLGELEFDNGTSVLTFSPDGSKLLAAAGASVQIWNIGTRKIDSTLNGLIGEVLEHGVHAGDMVEAYFSSDATRILTISRDGTLGLWEGHTGYKLGLVAARAGAGTSFSNDSKELLTIDDAGVVRTYLIKFSELLKFAQTLVTRDIVGG